jgi:hypothetical protein
MLLTVQNKTGTLILKNGTSAPLRSFHEVPPARPVRNAEGVGSMLTIALSLLFGLVAFAALAQIYFSVSAGMKRGRLILAELSRQEHAAVRARSIRRRARPSWQRALAAA